MMVTGLRQQMPQKKDVILNVSRSLVGSDGISWTAHTTGQDEGLGQAGGHGEAKSATIGS